MPIPSRCPRDCAGVAMIGTGLGDLVTENLVIRAPGGFTGARQRIEVALLSSEIPFDGAPEPALRAVSPLGGDGAGRPG